VVEPLVKLGERDWAVGLVDRVVDVATAVWEIFEVWPRSSC